MSMEVWTVWDGRHDRGCYPARRFALRAARAMAGQGAEPYYVWTGRRWLQVGWSSWGQATDGSEVPRVYFVERRWR